MGCDQYFFYVFPAFDFTKVNTCMFILCYVFYIKPRIVFTFGFSCSAYN